jgi:hypothetical protein
MTEKQITKIADRLVGVFLADLEQEAKDISDRWDIIEQFHEALGQYMDDFAMGGMDEEYN